MKKSKCLCCGLQKMVYSYTLLYRNFCTSCCDDIPDHIPKKQVRKYLLMKKEKHGKRM